MLEATAVNISELLEEMLYSRIFLSVFLTLPQLCSGFVSVLWWERSKLRPKKTGVKCSAGPVPDVSSESLVWSHAGVSCLPTHPLPVRASRQRGAQLLVLSSAAVLLGTAGSAQPRFTQRTGSTGGAESSQGSRRTQCCHPTGNPREQPWSFHLVS